LLRRGTEAVADGLWRHRLQPQAVHRFAQRLGATRILFNQTEDQLTLAPGVAGVHQLVDILAFGQFDHGVEPGFGFVHRLEFKVGRDHRQMGKTPFATFHVIRLGGLDFHQVSDSAGDHKGLVLKVLVVLLELARLRRECPHDVLCN
jgi:hypothetical protein